jgi:hypothetical protein
MAGDQRERIVKRKGDSNALARDILEHPVW